MTHQDITATAEPAVLAQYIADLPVPDLMPGSMESVREDEFEGHRIVVRTSYEITVDDRPVTAHLMVSNNGEVHCHALPALLGGDPDLATYDFAPWDAGSKGFRNRLEGFIGTGLHNQVHRWVGGDMGPASSPNDPVFYLHHCNVDRLWEGWMHHHGRSYAPPMTASADLLGHRIDDPIVTPLGPNAPGGTPRLTLDFTSKYTYDLVP
ncbi:tyrosinase family protein [Embleya sp. NPDC020630]|uniref:tyrosinase family protein n=1 Tax=Embleya sp. NPDC020630 TaxID=3363979 RepID=UPI0037B58A14